MTPINRTLPVFPAVEPSPQSAGCYRWRLDEPTPPPAADSQRHSAFLRPSVAAQSPAPVSAGSLSCHVGPSSSCAQTCCALLVQSSLRHSTVLIRLLQSCSITQKIKMQLPLAHRNCYKFVTTAINGKCGTKV